MKRIDLAISTVLVPIDYVMLVSAGLASYALRYQGFITRYRPVFFDYPFSEYFPSLLIIAGIGVVIFAFGGSYRITSSYRPLELLSKAFLGVSTTILLMIVAIFLKRELFSSRFVILFAWAAATVFVFLGRLIVFKTKSILLKRGIGTHGLVVIGRGAAQEVIQNFFNSKPQLGYRIIAIVPSLDQEQKKYIIKLITEKKVDEILDTRDAISKELLIESLNFCHENSINFRYIAGSYQTRTINMETDSIAGYPIIQINRTPLNGWGRVYKRSVDIIISFIGLIFLIPLTVIIGTTIKLDSKGTVFAKLNRVGKGGRVFTLYKFRSMVFNAHELKPTIMDYNERNDGPLFKMRNDPRITFFGRILRKSSIDELPQLWNVFKGEMSLVGPRPHEPEEVLQYPPSFRSLVGIKPGMTGMAQVAGRSNLQFNEEATIDLYYIEHWSLGLDLQILLKTLLVIFKFRDAS